MYSTVYSSSISLQQQQPPGGGGGPAPADGRAAQAAGPVRARRTIHTLLAKRCRHGTSTAGTAPPPENTILGVRSLAASSLRAPSVRAARECRPRKTGGSAYRFMMRIEESYMWILHETPKVAVGRPLDAAPSKRSRPLITSPARRSRTPRPPSWLGRGAMEGPCAPSMSSSSFDWLKSEGAPHHPWSGGDEEEEPALGRNTLKLRSQAILNAANKRQQPGAPPSVMASPPAGVGMAPSAYAPLPGGGRPLLSGSRGAENAYCGGGGCGGSAAGSARGGGGGGGADWRGGGGHMPLQTLQPPPSDWRGGGAPPPPPPHASAAAASSASSCGGRVHVQPDWQITGDLLNQPWGKVLRVLNRK